ncbi:MAG: FHA domain-containing protein, partial [Gemmatimonadaceae bacterium]
MPVLQLNDQQFPLQAGTTRVGAGGGADISLPGDPGLGVQAIIDRTSDKTAIVRRASPAAQVRVNGVLLGAEPTPLIHGDKLEIVGLELRFADDAKGGATQFVTASEIAAMAGTKRSGNARPTTASGGRLVSLVDGKEYTVPAAGIVLGRDASCDVVVAENEVSRRHAEIAPSEQGYVVRDMSANGVFVNGERVQGSQRLARSDVVRVGGEEFRFYADLLAQGPTPAAAIPATPAPA